MNYLLAVGLVLFPIGIIVCYFFTKRIIRKGFIVSPAVERGDKEYTYYRSKEPKSFWLELAFQSAVLMLIFSITLILGVIVLINE